MNCYHKSSSHVQMQAEDLLFKKVENLLNIRLEKNPKIYLSNNVYRRNQTSTAYT